MTYNIVRSNGHFMVYINNKFYCTADTIREATKEVEDYMKDGVQNENKSAYQKTWAGVMLR